MVAWWGSPPVDRLPCQNPAAFQAQHRLGWDVTGFHAESATRCESLADDRKPPAFAFAVQGEGRSDSGHDVVGHKQLRDGIPVER